MIFVSFFSVYRDEMSKQTFRTLKKRATTKPHHPIYYIFIANSQELPARDFPSFALSVSAMVTTHFFKDIVMSGSRAKTLNHVCISCTVIDLHDAPYTHHKIIQQLRLSV
jgi:hypothetical protein